MLDYVSMHGDELNTGIVGQTIHKHVPALQGRELFRLDGGNSFRSKQWQCNFVLLSRKKPLQKQTMREHALSKDLFLYVFIGLTENYPRNFVQDRAIHVDMEQYVDLKLQQDWNTKSKEEIEAKAYEKYFSPHRTARFFHVLVFKLNLQVFEKDEYDMLLDLVTAQNTVQPPSPHRVTIPQAIDTINTAAKHMAWQMAQHPALGKHSPASQLPHDAAELIAHYARLHRIQHTNTQPKQDLQPPPKEAMHK